MTAMTILARLAARVHRAPPEPAPQARHRDGADPAMKAHCTALAHFLGAKAADHHDLALRSRQAMQAALAGLAEPRPADMALVDPVQVQHTLEAALLQGATWLSLPYSTSGLQLLHQLAQMQQRVKAPITLVAAPGVDGLAGPGPHRLQVRPAAQAVREAKAALGRPGEPRLFVSFPELHALRADTTARVSFLSQPCRFALLEAALCGAGMPSLLSLRPAPQGHAGATLLVAWRPPEPAQPPHVGQHDAGQQEAGQRARLTAALSWLVDSLQLLAQAMPAQTGSWLHWYARSVHAITAQRGNRLRECQAFVDTWRRQGSGLSDEAHALLQARLRALQTAGSRG